LENLLPLLAPQSLLQLRREYKPKQLALIALTREESMRRPAAFFQFFSLFGHWPSCLGLSRKMREKKDRSKSTGARR
jgi:hypothetical protein